MVDADFNTLFSVLASSKRVFWAENAQLTEDQRQQLWNQRFGQLATQLCASSNPPQQQSDQQVLASRKRAMERTLSVSIPPAKRPALDPELHQAVDLRRHASTSAAANMSRKASLKSRKPVGPFSAEAAPISPLSMPSPIPPTALSSVSDAVTNMQQVTGRSRHPSLVANDIRDFSPQDYLSSLGTDDSSSPLISFTPATGNVSSNPSMQHPVLRQIHAENLEHHGYLSSPSTAVSEAMTRASTVATEPMSRNATNEMICSPLDMLRIKSNISTDFTTDESSFDDQISKTDSVNSVFPDTFPNETFFPQVDHSFAPDVPMFSSSPFFDHSFLCSSPLTHVLSQSSGGSVSSSSSSKSRASRRTQEQIASASRPIAPKKTEVIKSSSPARMVRVSSGDGKMKEVAQIPKTTYNRPAKQKTFCSECNDQPEGFHGEHELRRHIERVHSILRKVWVCKDISPDQKFLANCKACRNGKTYGANYNAAAHLRRTHFHPCKKGRGGRGKPSEKRGGKGGGDHPPMDELKHWMYQVDERVPIDGINHSLVENTPQSEEDLDDDNLNQVGSFEAPPSYALESYDHVDLYPTSDNIPRQQAIPAATDFSTFDTQPYPYIEPFALDNYLNNGYASTLDLQATSMA